MPQKDKDGNRTIAEAAIFKRALPVMNKLYASLTGTTVIQLKDIPARAPMYDGCIKIFDLPDGTDVRCDVDDFGRVLGIDVQPGVTSVRFETHEQARRCVAALRSAKRGADFEYNETHYDRTSGEPYSGWCSMEQASCTMVAAHLAKAEWQATTRSTTLPKRFALAQASRPKVIDISADASGRDEMRLMCVLTEDPTTLFAESLEAIKGATFIGKGDKDMVQQMLAEFEWIMHCAVEQAELAADGLDLTTDPKLSPPPPPIVAPAGAQLIRRRWPQRLLRTARVRIHGLVERDRAGERTSIYPGHSESAGHELQLHVRL